MQKNQSERILLHVAGVLGLVLVVAVWQHDYLAELYINNQLTQVGWVVNGVILLLFVLGMGRLVQLFLQYRLEEQALNDFSAALASGDDGQLSDALATPSIISERYQTIAGFFKARTEINHNALAATLLAKEASKTSFPKFINNILILTGVFGTIVSLTVALLGASTAMSATDSLRGIDIVIHGMSTALSTTMTAIVAYFLFGYFYLKLLDTQSYILGWVEHETATQLIPRYQVATRSPEQALDEMLTSMAETVENFNTFVHQIQSLGATQNQVLDNFEQLTDQNMRMLSDIRTILREGFRLRDESTTD